MGGVDDKTTRIDGSHAAKQGNAEARNTAPRRVGMIAGWGDYPIVIAEALRRQGCQTFCLGVLGHADPRLAEICTDFRFKGIGRFGAGIRYFKRHGVTEATMAGKFFKMRLFLHGGWIRHLPDLRTVRMFVPHFWTRRADCKDDTLTKTIVDEFASEGIRFRPATDYAPRLLVERGQLTRRGPSARQWQDIEFGWKIAKQLGRVDVGQSVVVKDRAVMALEAIEGTDQCIRRAGTLCRAGGFTVVKTAKPQQDMRFDVPAVGLGTLESMIEAGGRVLAIEAGRTIILSEPEVIDFANRNRLIIVSISNQQESSPNETTANVPETPSQTRKR